MIKKLLLFILLLPGLAWGGMLIGSGGVTDPCVSCTTSTDSELYSTPGNPVNNGEDTFGGAIWGAQSFTVADKCISEVVLHVSYNTSDSGDFTVKIYSNDSGKPGAAISGLVSTEVVSSLPSTPTDVVFSFPSAVSLSGTYHIVWYVDGAGSATYRFGTNPDTGESSNYSSNSGSSWTTYSTDYNIRVMGCTP